jgi:hypothetical protein
MTVYSEKFDHGSDGGSCGCAGCTCGAIKADINLKVGVLTTRLRPGVTPDEVTEFVRAQIWTRLDELTAEAAHMFTEPGRS